VTDPDGGPAPAERARSALAACPIPEVTAHGTRSLVPLHATDADGRPVLLVPDDSPPAAAVAGSTGDVPVVLRAAHLRPLQVVDRVRARVELHGRLDVVAPAERGPAMLRLAHLGGVAVAGVVLAGQVPAGHTLLRLRPDQVTLDGEPVDLAEFGRAAPDPFACREGELLRRLLRDRPEAVAGLCTLLDPAVLADATEIAPSGLDRHGLTIRASSPTGPRESRLAFPEPVACSGALEEAMRALLARSRRS
jgi:hypothetical protein